VFNSPGFYSPGFYSPCLILRVEDTLSMQSRRAGETSGSGACHFLASFAPISLEFSVVFTDIWPKFASLHFLASFGLFSLEFGLIFVDFWPKFAVVVRDRGQL
jgi:hypothetical protein